MEQFNLHNITVSKEEAEELMLTGSVLLKEMICSDCNNCCEETKIEIQLILKENKQ